MSNKQFKKKLMQYIEAWQNRDMDLADQLTDELYTLDAVQHAPGFPPMKPGPEGQKEYARDVIATNPDFRLIFDEFLFAEDKMILRGSAILNDPQTGAITKWAFLEIDRLVNDRIAEGWTLLNSGEW